jgi:hypothetical protein
MNKGIKEDEAFMVNKLLTEINYKIKMLKISELKFDTKNYQRDTSELKIKKIVRNFNWNAFGVIFVNKRSNGDYFVVDGQHRIVSAVRKKYKEVPCMVYEGLALEQEAELFIYYQINRNPIKTYEKYKALLISGDKATNEIQLALEKHKLIPSNGRADSSSRKKGYVNSLGSLYKIHNAKGYKWLDTVINIIVSIWRFNDGTHDPDSLTSNMFLGMHMFLTKSYNKINERRFIDKFKKISANKILNMADKNQAVYGKGKASNTARAILEVYNNRNSNKLEINF